MRNVTRRLVRLEQQVPTLPRLADDKRANTILVASVYEQRGAGVCYAWLLSNGVSEEYAREIVDAMNAVADEP